MALSHLPESIRDTLDSGVGKRVNIALSLERRMNMADLLPLRRSIEIRECGEALHQIPNQVFSFEMPHPYQSVGAPYGKLSPYFLRSTVLARLQIAQNLLSEKMPGSKLHIFDAYRPIEVQEYMVAYSRALTANAMGFDVHHLTAEQETKVMTEVLKVWAKPTRDPMLPPPHSTGSAVDLTIVNALGVKVAMGSEFDEASDRTLPNHYLDDPSILAQEAHLNRELLHSIMSHAGFSRMTHEWWHFSFGDQMAVLIEQLRTGDRSTFARYGGVAASSLP